MSFWDNLIYFGLIRPLYLLTKFFESPIRHISYLFTDERLHNSATREDADIFATGMYAHLHRYEQQPDGSYKVHFSIGSTTGKQVRPGDFINFRIPEVETIKQTSYDHGHTIHEYGITQKYPERLAVYYTPSYGTTIDADLMIQLVPDPTMISNAPRKRPTVEELFFKK